MKLVSFEIDGVESFGAVVKSGVVDLKRLCDDRYPDLRAVLAADAVDGLAAMLEGRRADYPIERVTLLPVIPNPGKIWCCGLNYYEHVEECGATPANAPLFFLRTPSSQVAHDAPVLRPHESEQFDFEGELAVVIGKPGRRIPAAEAHRHVAGYACYNDVSVRDWQLRTSQWDVGKNFWRTGSFGPWLVTADEIAFGSDLALVTRLNSEVVQRSSTRMMIHDIAAQIAHLSTIAPLEAGDVIVTGTPGGIGAMRKPALWMKDGDTVEVEIERVGVLRNTVAAD
ncbi:2-keto-4-pentenoate hydratase/2-oxohepta-3-ene-1,7-dioic acid hydratase in catechol pathway [Paraburkholderia unamae]|uniref:fumarylacetoacetate hydrolase family protein n=1 Tax=Paraburkholderia unamae TaxID=219649 RepID=UPI000DC4D5FC|nr:fumarylacetoacetate hydrolase family protein [Paraburkholderia unamae]RAR57159.1 2-keto-4-pentenoate hydratase/2-oxohepta-3-ene-1,7-dioic acid hydratase in catechol pathway [Paraburkholderia unamae]